MSTIITAAESFTDIDAYACAIAYAELLQLEGQQASVVLPGPLNHSVSPTVKSWPAKMSSEPEEHERVVIVDVSNPDAIASFVDEKKVSEIYDHHPGFGNYWQEKMGQGAHIEMIGACATLIWEQYKERGHTDDISTASANLLATAIISNTLNFQGAVTHQRDKDAAKELQTHTPLPSNWTEKYFNEQRESIEQNAKDAIIHDTKIETTAKLGPIAIGQLELWQAGDFIQQHRAAIEQGMQAAEQRHWYLSIISIADSKNYIIASGEEVQDLLTKEIDCRFENGIGQTSKLWMRKEVLKKLQVG